jgi:hypothetical protein
MTDCSDIILFLLWFPLNCKMMDCSDIILSLLWFPLNGKMMDCSDIILLLLWVPLNGKMTDYSDHVLFLLWLSLSCKKMDCSDNVLLLLWVPLNGKMINCSDRVPPLPVVCTAFPLWWIVLTTLSAMLFLRSDRVVCNAFPLDDRLFWPHPSPSLRHLHCLSSVMSILPALPHGCHCHVSFCRLGCTIYMQCE